MVTQTTSREASHAIDEIRRGEIVPSNSDIENEFVRPSAAAAVEIQSTRAIQEVRAAYMMAQQFPRNENQAFQNIMLACKRKRLAEVAEYEYPRGNERITGPTIRLAEVLKQYWGHLDSGFVEVDQRKGWSTVMAYAVDLQSGARETKTFQVEHVRHTKHGRKALTDPRDIYEHVANQAARRQRACILALIPGDFVEAAVEQCRKTLKSNDVPLEERIKKMVAAFGEHQVTVEMIEKLLGMPLKSASENQVARLRRVYQSLMDGVATREQLFGLDEGPKPEGDSEAVNGAKTKSGAVAEKLKGKTAEKAAETKPADAKPTEPSASLEDFK